MSEAIPSRERPAKLLETATASEHSELQIISRCIEEASLALKMYFVRFQHGLPENEEEAAIRRALFRDGLIQIMACFSTNPNKRDRYLIPSEAFDGQQGWEPFYKWMLDLRDGYAAHNFGAQRLADSIVFLDSDTGQVAGVGIITVGFDGPSEGEASFSAFCGTAMRHAKSRMEQASAKLLAEAQALSKAELEALHDAALVVPGAEDVKTSREKYRTKTKGS